MLSHSHFLMAASHYKPDSTELRNKVPEKYHWDLSPIYTSDKSWKKDFKAISKRVNSFDCPGNNPDADGILACLSNYFSLSRDIGSIAFYASLTYSADNLPKKNQKMYHDSQYLYHTFTSKALPLRMAILSLSKEKMDLLLAKPDALPYRPYLKDLYRRHTRLNNKRTEEVLALFGDNLWAEIDLNEIPSDVELIFKAMLKDITFPDITNEKGEVKPLTLTNFGKYRRSKDRSVRKEAVQNFFSTLMKNKDVFAAILGAEFKRDVKIARAHNYETAIEGYLDRDNVDIEVVKNLISTVNKNIKPLHRYTKLRKRMMGLKSIHYYDLYAPLFPALSEEISFKEAQEDIIASLKPMGKTYQENLARNLSLTSGWLDLYPNKGKRGGAFCAAIWGKHPYVFMNFMNTIDGVYTLAHEYGHAMHYWLNMSKTTPSTFGFSAFIAEIASTFNEVMLTRYLLEKYEGNDQVRLGILGRELENIRTTLYRQTLFAEFEYTMHEYAEKGEPLTADLFNDTYASLVKKYYGPAFTIDEYDGIEWAYVPHFFWKFYVFSYATGISSGIALSDNVLHGGKKGLRDYITMLEQPRTENPVAILKKAGVDMTKPHAIKAATKRMNDIIDEIEKILDRMES
jgi:oligoendopeptidase F